jgi:dTDP-4-amino-4,6-dideoxygalactose transaminase
MSPSTSFIPFARPSLGSEEEDAVLSVLKSGWLTTGDQAFSFEREFSRYCGVKHALAVNSATAGLHLALEALNLEPGSLVATTPYTFAASAEVIRYVGCHPLFIDIEEESFNMDPSLLEKALEEKGNRVKAVLPVHIAGRPCNLEALGDLCRRHRLPMVEDAAHAFPVKLPEGFVGAFGEAGVYSFYANKTITTGEGGMIVTNRDDLACRMRVMRLHGIDRDSWNRYTSEDTGWEYEIIDAGYKYNMSDLAAAIGRVQLKKADAFLKRRREIASRYIRSLSEADFLVLPRDLAAHAWHLFIIRIAAHLLTIDRDEFARRLKGAGVGVSVHYIPLHLMPYYRERYGYRAEDYPVSLKNFRSSISLPIYPSLSAEETDRIIDAVKKIGYNARRRRLTPAES